MTNKSSAERAQRLAHDLALTIEELRRLRQQLTAAESNLVGVPGKLNMTAQRLSLTPMEVKKLRGALSSDVGVERTASDRLLAQHVIRLPTIRAKYPDASTQATPPVPRTKPAKSRAVHYSRAPETGVTPGPRVVGKWSADTLVYLTSLGDAVHLYSDCHGMRGFRHAEEPDPVVHQVRLRDPTCAERRACRKCFNVWSPTMLERLDGLIEGLHGTSILGSRQTSASKSLSRTQKTSAHQKSSTSARSEVADRRR